MLINIEQWRAGIRTFCGLIFPPTIQKSFVISNHNFEVFVFNFLYNSLLSILVIKAVDIKVNPTPNKMSFLLELK